MISHAQISEICEEVRLLKLQGLTIPQISHRLARQYTPPENQKGNWQSNHVIQIFDYLREKGELPKNHVHFRSRYARKRK
jgi:hypothetical protein